MWFRFNERNNVTEFRSNRLRTTIYTLDQCAIGSTKLEYIEG